MPLGLLAKRMLTNKSIKLSFLLTLAISVLISSVSLFMYQDYRSRIDKELNQPMAELLQINMHMTNRAFRNYDNIAVQLSFHPLAVAYVEASLRDKKEAGARLLSHFKSSAYEEEITSVYVVDLVHRRYASSAPEGEQDFSGKAGHTWIPWATAMDTEPLLIKRRTAGDDEVQSPAQSELISLYRPIRSGDKLIGLVILNIDYDRLFTSIHTQLNAPLYIYNLEGEQIYPKRSLPGAEEHMRQVVEELNIQPFTEVELDKQLYLANQTFSDMTGWRWVSFISLEDLLKHAKLVRNIIISLSLLSILIGCAALWYYRRTAFRPLNRIRGLLGQKEKSGEPDDLHQVEQYLQSLLKDYDATSAISRQSLPELRSKFVEDVLFRRIGASEIQYKWRSYFQDWSEAPITAAVVSINRYKAWSAEFTEEDQLLLKYALSNLVHEVLNPQWHSIHTSLDKENMLVILQPRGGPPAYPDPCPLFDRMIEMSRHYLRLQLSIGLGPQAASIAELHHSFAGAKSSLTRRLYEGYGTTLSIPAHDHLPGFTRQEAEKWEREWLGSVEAGDAEAVTRSIREWSQSVRHLCPAPESVYAFADRWIGKLVEVTELHGLARVHDLEDYTAHQLNMMDLEDTTALLLNLSQATAEGIRSRMNRKEHSTVQQIIQLMEEELSGNIGLQQIADSIRMSTSSVSSLFKQQTGCSVYEYLTRLRIDRACRLLMETDRKVGDIAPLVGYQNETSFIRSFRKVKGMTPGKYREVSRTNGA
ncbi:AraC-like DNA-binding protein [Paenibacillus mucilaginosus]|uniref:helix-turn-helix domain-containing protein n=1 Tax=Paenibacillus mucilaginosus TaxID=61624 RepID=UPI003D1939EE